MAESKNVISSSSGKALRALVVNAAAKGITAMAVQTNQRL
jgi:hypothetical protein